MKTLFVLRHAKSSWDDADLADFDRPLNDRGRSTAPFMGELMEKNGFSPDVILSSPAVRARVTASLAKEAGNINAEIVHDESIYEASMVTLLKIASGIDDQYRSAMIVGHNPGMEGIVRQLTGRSEAMPTAALAVIDLDVGSWQNIEPGCGILRNIFRPRNEMKTFES